jgi:hypothetical protein
MTLTEVDGNYTFNISQQNAEGNGLHLPVEKLRWYNLRIEFDDVSKIGSEMRVYVDGTLVHTALLTKTASALSHFMLRYKYATLDGRLLLDNTYFAATGEKLPETPDTPDTPTEPDTPEVPVVSGARGDGAYKDNENTLDFTDKTATELGASGIITANGGATLDGEDIFAKVVDVNGDNALVLGNNQWNKQGYINIKANGIGTKYIFETDLMVDSSVIAPGTGRTGFELFDIYTGSSDSSSNWLWTTPKICMVDGECIVKIGNNSAKIKQGEWINLRVELDDTTTLGSAVRYYINGELFAELALTKTCTDLSHIRIWMPPSCKGTLTLDNVCFITLDPKTEGDDGEVTPDVGGEGGGEIPDDGGDPEGGEGDEGDGDSTVTSGRGSGSYAENGNALTYTDTTASALGESGKLVVNGGATIDGVDMSASVTDVDGDAALKLSNNQHAKEAYFNVKADSLGTKYVFETDMMIASGASSRGDKTFLTFYSSNLENASSTYWWGMPGANLCVETGTDGEKVYKVTCGGNEVEVKAGEWFNVRYEFDNTGATGNEIRFYVNGELLYTGANTKTTTALRFIRIFVPQNSLGEVYLDNTYFSAITG